MSKLATLTNLEFLEVSSFALRLSKLIRKSFRRFLKPVHGLAESPAPALPSFDRSIHRPNERGVLRAITARGRTSAPLREYALELSLRRWTIAD